MRYLLWAGLFIMGTVSNSGALDAASASRNLIKNSSFEAITEDGLSKAWNTGENEKAISLDAANSTDGKYCVHFTLDGTEAMLGEGRFLDLIPGRSYTFSAYIRTKNLDPASGLRIEVINCGWSFGPQTRLPVKDLTADWRRYSLTFVCPAADTFKYQGRDNVAYKVNIFTKGVTGEAWIDAIQLEESDHVTDYMPAEGKSEASTDRVADAAALASRRAAAGKTRYFEIKKPLFEELLTNEPGQGYVLYYGLIDIIPEVSRPLFKKFGLRYVQDEEIADIRNGPFVALTNAWARGGVGSYPTMRGILRYDVQDVAPKMLDGNPWIMHPKWQEAYLKEATRLAQLSLDQSPKNAWGNTFGIWAGDEIFESFAIKVVPMDKRDDAVRAIDREIKEKFGFGKYGMPESPTDPDPLKRIAYRRWINARLTETYAKARETVKKINPRLVMLSPNISSAGVPMDIEAMSPYFDAACNQSATTLDPFTRRLSTGADTKALADLSGLPVFGAVQHHFVRGDPQALREEFSQIFRNGGQGVWLHAAEWWDRELETGKYTNTLQWRAMREICDMAAKMNKVKLPTPDTAMLYASDTFLTHIDNPKMSNEETPQVYAAYAALGPCVGTWFSFVSDRQIDRGTRQLGNYKALYIPRGMYERGAVLDKMEQYLREGGTVICTDPTAFTWDINGESLTARWEKITGVRTGRPLPPEKTSATVRAAGFLRLERDLAITLPTPGVELTVLDPSVRPLASYDDGSPAATIRTYGKGNVIFFGSDPFLSQDKNSGVIALVRSIQLAVGAQTDLDIWRFKLPPFKTVYVADPEAHKCLTNNAVDRTFYLGNSDAKSVHNLATGGAYTYDRFPTGIADVAKAGEISFDQGHLTNRKLAYASRNLAGERNPPELEKWIVSYSNRNPVTLTVDLKKPYALDRFTLFYSGILPDLTIEGSADRQQWERLGSCAVQRATEDVIDVSVPVKGKYRYVRARFAQRREDVMMELCEMELCEMEIWGSEK